MSGVTKKPLFLSASRIDVFLSCSALYVAKYLWRLPDTGNDGSRRGSTVHEVLELLAKPRHRKHYEQAILHDTCTEVPALWKLVQRIARRFQVCDPDNLAIIDQFILVALKDEFYGPKGTFEDLTEQAFELKIDRGDGRRYSVRGYVDRVFKVRDKWGLLLKIVDFKSSKDFFKGDKAAFNIQSQIYQLAVRELFPEFKRRAFHFLFLKFPKKPRQEQPTLTDSQLNGFEWILTEYQRAMESFTEENACDHFAADDVEKQWLCGRPGFKKDGKPNWICPAREPMDYWVELDGKTSEIVTSAFEESGLKPKEGNRVEMRHYPGCPRFYDPQTGKRRNFSQ